MSPVRILLVSLVVAGGLVLLAPTGPAAACSCALQDDEDEVASSSALFVGLLVDRDENGGSVSYDFEVDTVFKGAVNEQTRVWTGAHEAACGRPGLDEGSRYLVFADADRDGRLHVGLCDATTKADTANVDRVEALTGPPRSPDPGGVRIDQDEPGQPWIPYWVMVGIAAGAVGLLGVLLFVLRRLRRD